MLLFDRRGHRAQADGRRARAARGRPAPARGCRANSSSACSASRPAGRRSCASRWTRSIPWRACCRWSRRFYADCTSARGAHTRLRLSREVLGGAWDALAEGRADLVLGAPGDAPPGGGYRLRVLAEVTMRIRRRTRPSARRRAEPLDRGADWRASRRRRRRQFAPAAAALARHADRPGHADRAGSRREARRAGRGAGLRLSCRLVRRRRRRGRAPGDQDRRIRRGRRSASRLHGASRVPATRSHGGSTRWARPTGASSRSSDAPEASVPVPGRGTRSRAADVEPRRPRY